MKLFLESSRQPTRAALDLLIGLGLMLLAAVAWSRFGFLGWLWRDDAVYLYGGQLLLEGVMPYESIFDHKTPLATMLCGLGMGIGRVFGTDDVVAARILFCVLSIASVGAVYGAVRAICRERWAAIIAALVLVAAWGFGREAVSGPNAKTPMVLFEALFLWSAARKRWACAGIWAALATWTWQPGFCFVIAGAIAAWLAGQRSAERRRALLFFAGGVLLPTLPLAFWFAAAGAFGPLIEGSTLFNLLHLERHPPDLFTRLMQPWRIALHAHAYVGIALVAGLAWLWIEALAALRKRSGIDRQDRAPRHPLFIALPFPFFWSFFDFQGVADFFPFLPFACMGVGLLVERVVTIPVLVGPSKTRLRALIAGPIALLLASSSVWLYHDRSEVMLLTQRYAAHLVDEAHGPDAPILSVGLPEILVIQGKANPNRYAFIINGIDNLIEAQEPGGFTGWVNRLEASMPPLVAWGPTDGPHVHQLETWLAAHYEPKTFGYWQIYERRSTGD